MQHLFYHLSNEAVGNSPLCVERLPNRVRTCDHDLSARNLDWILKLRDHPSGALMIVIAMYIDDVQLLHKLVRIGACLLLYDSTPKRIGPLVTRHLLEVSLIDRSGGDIGFIVRKTLLKSLYTHQLVGLLDKEFPNSIDRVKLWQTYELPSTREVPCVFDQEAIYAEGNVRQGLDHIVNLMLQPSINYVHFPRLIRAFLEINDRDSIERLWHSRNSRVAEMFSKSFENPFRSGFCYNLDVWQDLPCEDWKWLWELMDGDQRTSIQNSLVHVGAPPVAEWCLSVGCKWVFIADPFVDFEWKHANGIRPCFNFCSTPSCALMERFLLDNPLLEVPSKWVEEASTQTLIYMKEKGQKLPEVIYRYLEDLDCYTEWLSSHYERVSIMVLRLRSTPLSN